MVWWILPMQYILSTSSWAKSNSWPREKTWTRLILNKENITNN